MRSFRLLALAAGLLLTACAGAGSDGSGAVPADSTVELPAPAPGPVPTLAVSPRSAAASPLPDIAVRRLNGEGGWVQFKDELPSEQPLLVWFWAPH